MNQILLTYDDSWSTGELKDAADSLEDTLPGVVKAEVVNNCGGCGMKTESQPYKFGPDSFTQPEVGYGYVDLKASANALAIWMRQKNEQDIIEHFAKVDLLGLILMRDCINKAIEKVSKEEIKPV